MKKWLKILLVCLGAFIIGGFIIFFLGTVKKGPNINTSPPPTSYPQSSSTQSGFDAQKSSQYYTVYFHKGDEANADKTLTLLDQTVDKMYKIYLGIMPQDTQVYLTKTVDEYVKVADFPGGAQNVQVGDGSAPNGKIFLYKPFDNPDKGAGVIVHEGTHAAIWSFLGGSQKMESLSNFLNEGLAYHMEYIHNAGENYNPAKEIYFSDTLRQAVKTGNPTLMTLDELGQGCEGYISDQTKNNLCRGQGTFIVWYMTDTYGKDFWKKFLADLKLSNDWAKSLENISGKNISDLESGINSALNNKFK